MSGRQRTTGPASWVPACPDVAPLRMALPGCRECETAGKAVFGHGFRVGVSRGRRLHWPEAAAGAFRPAAAPATTHAAAGLRSRARAAARAAFVAHLVAARGPVER
ncbi:hypothetical protein GCM10027039_20330 [Terrabacter koreensis]